MRRMNRMPGQDGLTFRKMHGAGNDFVLIDSRGRGAVMTPALARALGDRHRGVGFDQLAELRGKKGGMLVLDFWNADGSRTGACGNATRCAAAQVMDETGRQALEIETARGRLFAERREGAVWVNMGAPILDWRAIPLSRDVDPAHLPLVGDPAAVGMGNPHCVFVVADAEAAPVGERGPAIERDPLFPEGTNVEFVSRLGPDRLRMRVWERGTGVTLACGSGACAAAVAANRRGLTGRRVAIVADGGELQVDWRDDGAWLSGPVAPVFDGRLGADFLAGVA
jgi:diaminopimelate epimerase